MLMLSKLDSKYKHTQTSAIYTKELGLNVMIKNMLRVLFAFISPHRKSAGCNGSLDTCIQHKQL